MTWDCILHFLDIALSVALIAIIIIGIVFAIWTRLCELWQAEEDLARLIEGKAVLDSKMLETAREIIREATENLDT